MSNMFNKFRRSSKTSRLTESSPRTQQPPAAMTTPPETNFFHLPAELRNVIYDLAAQDTTLQISEKRSAWRHSRRRNDTIPSLLLTSRQCRAEYLPVLLATAPIEVEITNFDFSKLMRITRSLYSTDLKAMCSNANLVLRLNYPKAIKNVERGLRTWITDRHGVMDRVPWHYALPKKLQGLTKSYSHCMDEYHLCMSVLVALHLKVDESLQWELQIMMCEIENMEKVDAEKWTDQYAKERSLIAAPELDGTGVRQEVINGYYWRNPAHMYLGPDYRPQLTYRDQQ